MTTTKSKTGPTKMADVRSGDAPADNSPGNVVHSATSDKEPQAMPLKGDEAAQVRHINRQIVENWIDTISPAEARKVADYADKKAG